MQAQQHPPGTLIRTKEAAALTNSLEDPITRILVNNAQYHVYRRMASNSLPVGEFDLLFFIEIMADMFSEQDVLKRMLAGERVGAFFDEE